MELIKIYNDVQIGRYRRLTFLPNGTEVATIVCTREHEMDWERGRLIVPSASDGPEFTAGQAFLAARVGLFGFRIDDVARATPGPAPANRKPRIKK